MEQPRLLLPDQAARLLSMKKRSLLHAAAQGLVPCVRIGRRVLFDREALNDFIKSGGRRERAS